MKTFFGDLAYNYRNIIPKDGKAFYFGKIMSDADAEKYFEQLLNYIPWQNDVVMMFGKKIITKRKTAWFGDKPFNYTYSKITRKALSWTDMLMKLKQITEEVSKENFNSCLLNLYHNGSESMSWHSDDEKELKENGAIASLSFGAERIFVFKHKRSGEKLETLLENGSLLVMKDNIQTHWKHRLPPSKKIMTPRINLTFRTIVEKEHYI